jgi:hypothetical protein
VQQQNLDATLAHDVDEGVELLPGMPHPDHVVEEQLMAVGGGESLVREVRTMHHHRPELSDLRVRPECRFGGRAHVCPLLS